MTKHSEWRMCHEDRRIHDRESINILLSHMNVATVCMHDVPYPYAVAMNYGYEWKNEKELFFYFHMAKEGHKLELLLKNPMVSVSIYEFLDRRGYMQYQGEEHDYRSIHAYGKAEIIPAEHETEFLHGMSLLLKNNGRPPVKHIYGEMKTRLYILRVRVDFVTAKAQYPIRNMVELVIPQNQEKV